MLFEQIKRLKRYLLGLSGVLVQIYSLKVRCTFNETKGFNVGLNVVQKKQSVYWVLTTSFFSLSAGECTFRQKRCKTNNICVSLYERCRKYTFCV